MKNLPESASLLRRCTNFQRAFSLVEIMLVVGIIALLAAVAIPNFLRARERSQATMVLNMARSIDHAIIQWAMQGAVPRSASVPPTAIAPLIKDGVLSNNLAAGNLSVPGFPGMAFQLGTLGEEPQVRVIGTSFFDPAIVPPSFWEGF